MLPLLLHHLANLFAYVVTLFVTSVRQKLSVFCREGRAREFYLEIAGSSPIPSKILLVRGLFQVFSFIYIICRVLSSVCEAQLRLCIFQQPQTRNIHGIFRVCGL